MLLDEAEPSAEQRAQLPKDVLEVRKYVKALEQGIEKMKKLPLSLRLVRELHRLLMWDVADNRVRGGEFRTTQNWIGPPGSTLATASFVPPPPKEMQPAHVGRTGRARRDGEAQAQVGSGRPCRAHSPCTRIATHSPLRCVARG